MGKNPRDIHHHPDLMSGFQGRILLFQILEMEAMRSFYPFSSLPLQKAHISCAIKYIAMIMFNLSTLHGKINRKIIELLLNKSLYLLIGLVPGIVPAGNLSHFYLYGPPALGSSVFVTAILPSCPLETGLPAQYQHVGHDV